MRRLPAAKESCCFICKGALPSPGSLRSNTTNRLLCTKIIIILCCIFVYIWMLVWSIDHFFSNNDHHRPNIHTSASIKYRDNIQRSSATPPLFLSLYTIPFSKTRAQISDFPLFWGNFFVYSFVFIVFCVFSLSFLPFQIIAT